MALSIRKLINPFRRRPLPQEQQDNATSREKTDEGTPEGGDIGITQVTGLEELVNKRPKDLAEATEQLSQISDTVKIEGKDEAQAKDILEYGLRRQPRLRKTPGCRLLPR